MVTQNPIAVDINRLFPSSNASPKKGENVTIHIPFYLVRCLIQINWSQFPTLLVLLKVETLIMCLLASISSKTHVLPTLRFFSLTNAFHPFDRYLSLAPFFCFTRTGHFWPSESTSTISPGALGRYWENAVGTYYINKKNCTMLGSNEGYT